MANLDSGGGGDDGSDSTSSGSIEEQVAAAFNDDGTAGSDSGGSSDTTTAPSGFEGSRTVDADAGGGGTPTTDSGGSSDPTEAQDFGEELGGQPVGSGSPEPTVEEQTAAAFEDLRAENQFQEQTGQTVEQAGQVSGAAGVNQEPRTTGGEGDTVAEVDRQVDRQQSAEELAGEGAASGTGRPTTEPAGQAADTEPSVQTTGQVRPPLVVDEQGGQSSVDAPARGDIAGREQPDGLLSGAQQEARTEVSPLTRLAVSGEQQVSRARANEQAIAERAQQGNVFAGLFQAGETVQQASANAGATASEFLASDRVRTGAQAVAEVSPTSADNTVLSAIDLGDQVSVGAEGETVTDQLAGAGGGAAAFPGIIAGGSVSAVGASGATAGELGSGQRTVGQQAALLGDTGATAGQRQTVGLASDRPVEAAVVFGAPVAVGRGGSIARGARSATRDPVGSLRATSGRARTRVAERTRGARTAARLRAQRELGRIESRGGGVRGAVRSARDRLPGQGQQQSRSAFERGESDPSAFRTGETSGQSGSQRVQDFLSDDRGQAQLGGRQRQRGQGDSEAGFGDFGEVQPAGRRVTPEADPRIFEGGGRRGGQRSRGVDADIGSGPARAGRGERSRSFAESVRQSRRAQAQATGEGQSVAPVGDLNQRIEESQTPLVDRGSSLLGGQEDTGLLSDAAAPEVGTLQEQAVASDVTGAPAGEGEATGPGFGERSVFTERADTLTGTDTLAGTRADTQQRLGQDTSQTTDQTTTNTGTPETTTTTLITTRTPTQPPGGGDPPPVGQVGTPRDGGRRRIPDLEPGAPGGGGGDGAGVFNLFSSRQVEFTGADVDDLLGFGGDR
jgi:hypothetical protein